MMPTAIETGHAHQNQTISTSDHGIIQDVLIRIGEPF